MISVLLFVVCGPLQLTHSQLLCDDLSLVMMVFYFNPYWQTSVGMTLLILPTVFCLPIIELGYFHWRISSHILTCMMSELTVSYSKQRFVLCIDNGQQTVF